MKLKWTKTWGWFCAAGYLLFLGIMNWKALHDPGAQERSRAIQKTTFSPLDFCLGMMAAFAIWMTVWMFEQRRYYRDLKKNEHARPPFVSRSTWDAIDWSKIKDVQ